MYVPVNEVIFLSDTLVSVLKAKQFTTAPYSIEWNFIWVNNIVSFQKINVEINHMNILYYILFDEKVNKNLFYTNKIKDVCTSSSKRQ